MVLQRSYLRSIDLVPTRMILCPIQSRHGSAQGLVPLAVFKTVVPCRLRYGGWVRFPCASANLLHDPLGSILGTDSGSLYSSFVRDGPWNGRIRSMMKSRLHLLVLLLLLLGACSSVDRASVSDKPYQPTEAPKTEAPTARVASVKTAALDAPLPFDSGLTTGELDNGLKYYIRQNKRPENRAELRLMLRAGSLMEDDDQQGLAHFVEHMAFNGTRHFEKQELVEYLESIGMRFGAHLNAYTSFDETVYMLTVPTDDQEILDKAFLILEDWAQGIAFEGEEIDKERGVVVEEWRLGRGAGARIRDKQFPLLFKDSRYADRLPIGQKEILETAPHDALKRFYRDWYRPDLMAIVAVGDFDTAAMEARIRQQFSTLKNPENPRERVPHGVPEHEETLWSSLTDPEIPTTSVSIYYKLPRESEGNISDYRRGLQEALYSTMLNARLGELAQKPDPPFLFGYGAKASMVATKSVFVQGAVVREGGIERGLETVLVEAERVDRHGFTQSELDRAKKELLRGYEQSFRERDKTPSSALAAECGRHFLEGESVPGIEAELHLAQRFIPRISLGEVNQLAKAWITEENRVVLLSGPEKESTDLPSKEKLLAVMDAVEGLEVEPWVDEVREAPLVAEEPKGGRVTRESRIDGIDVTEWRLDNGVRVILKPTDFRNDQILLTATSPGGVSLVSDEDHHSAAFATSIISESGYGEFSSIEFNKALAGKVLRGSPNLGELAEGFRGSASPEDFETLLQLVYLAFTAPRFDADAYESLRARWKVVLENRSSDPSTVFQDKLTEVLSSGHPRRRPITVETLDKIDPEKSLAIYRERFSDASDFTFVLVGNFKPEEIRPHIEKWLGGLPSTGREETWRDIGVQGPDEVVRFEVKKGLEPKSRVRLIFSGPTEWSREAGYDILSLARVTNQRLREVLREDLGGTYGVRVSGSISQRPREDYSLSISFGCAPDQVDNLVDALMAELESIRENGIEESDLDNVKQSIHRQRETDLKENSYWLSMLSTYYDRDHDPLWILNVEEVMDAVTTDRVREAARRYLDPQRYVLGVLYPEETAEGSASGSE